MYMRRLTTMISRRDFLKGAGVAALAVAATGVLAGCSDAATNTIPTPTPAPAPDPAPAVQTATLADGVVLTIESTARENVLPNSTTGTQYLGVKIKLANDSKENVKLNWKNFKCNASGKWEFAMDAEKLGSTRKKWLEEKLDAPYIGYYGKGEKPGDGFGGSDDNMGVDANINSFGAAGTTLEAGLLFTTTTETKTCDLYVTYGSKVFKFTLDI